MRRKRGFNWFAVLLGFVLFLCFVTPVAELEYIDLNSTMSEVLPSGNPHSPIVIDGDINFNDSAFAEGWLGNGSAQNPFIIDGLDINLGGAAGHCISISNTLSNFEINNCNLTGASVSPGSGIYLYNVTNGELINNTCTNNIVGIFLDSSSSTTVDNNSCDNNDIGIEVVTGGNNTVTSNTCGSNNFHGILLTSSLSNNVTRNRCNNNIQHGIYLYSLNSNNRLVDNYCDNNSYGVAILWQAYANTVVNNTCTNNNHGIRVESSQSGQTFINNTSNNNQYGIYFFNSDYNSLVNNTCHSNGFGIYHEGAHDNTLSTNILNFNEYGFYLEHSDDNTLSNNTIDSNDYGIYLEDNCFYDVFIWNTLMDNINSAIDNNVVNLNSFDYNYWSDYTGPDDNADGIGDSSYQVAGAAMSEDPHPLMLPPDRPPLSWIESPTNKTIEISESFRYDLNITGYSYVDNWWLNDTLIFDVDQDGVVTNITVLSFGTFGLRIFVNDTYGNAIWGDFTVTVKDLSPPVWSESPIDQIIEYGVSFYFDLNATDNVGLSTWWLNDTSHFAVNNNGTLTTIGIVTVGVYGLQIWVNDTSNNVITTTFMVTVVDTKPPVWIETPQNQTVKSGISFVCDFDATDPSGISEWWVDDTVHFTIDWTGQVRTVGILQPGVYGLRVYVSDIYGHTLWAAIFVEVTTATTTTTTTTTPTTTDTIPEGMDPIMTLVLGAGIGGGVVVILFIVLLRKRS